MRELTQINLVQFLFVLVFYLTTISASDLVCNSSSADTGATCTPTSLSSNVRVVSWFSQRYASKASRLQASCKRMGVDCFVSHISDHFFQQQPQPKPYIRQQQKHSGTRSKHPMLYTVTNKSRRYRIPGFQTLKVLFMLEKILERQHQVANSLSTQSQPQQQPHSLSQWIVYVDSDMVVEDDVEKRLFSLQKNRHTGDSLDTFAKQSFFYLNGSSQFVSAKEIIHANKSDIMYSTQERADLFSSGDSHSSVNYNKRDSLKIDAAMFNWRAHRFDLPPMVATGVMVLKDTSCTHKLLLLWLAAMAFSDNMYSADDRVLSSLLSHVHSVISSSSHSSSSSSSFNTCSSKSQDLVEQWLVLHQKCHFGWLPPEFLALPRIPAFTKMFGRNLSNVLFRHPDAVTPSKRNSLSHENPPLSFYHEVFSNTSRLLIKLGMVAHQERKNNLSSLFPTVVNFLTENSNLTRYFTMQCIETNNQHSVSRYASENAQVHMQNLHDISILTANEQSKLENNIISKSTTTKTAKHLQSRARMFLMIDMSPQEQFGKALRAISATVQMLEQYVIERSNDVNSRDIVLVLPRVRCLYPLRYISFVDLIDVDVLHQAVSFNVTTIETFTDERYGNSQSNQPIPLLYRFENKRYGTTCNSVPLEQSQGSCTAITQQSIKALRNIVFEVANKNPHQGLLPHEPSKVISLSHWAQQRREGDILIAVDGITFQDRNNEGLVQLQALQLSNRVRTLANRFLLESHSLRSAAATSSFDISASDFFAVHWRQKDFLKLRSAQSDVLVSAENLVHIIRHTLRQFDLSSVYIATDSNNEQIWQYLSNALGDSLLPRLSQKWYVENDHTSFIDHKNNQEYVKGGTEAEARSDPQIMAMTEACICSQATLFAGTRTSSFTILIASLRQRQVELQTPQNQAPGKMHLYDGNLFYRGDSDFGIRPFQQ